jgi:hypothetical protein
MKKFLVIYTLIIFSLASCGTVSSPVLTNTPTPSSTPQPTETVTPTNTPTRTPKPTATPFLELTPSDVALPFDSAVVNPVYVPCYLFTSTMFHAGDGIIFDSHEGKLTMCLLRLKEKSLKVDWLMSQLDMKLPLKHLIFIKAKGFIMIWFIVVAWFLG